MKIRFPSYYKDFKCIADRCKNSCCVGWEICVDGETLDRHKRERTAFSDELFSVIDHSDGEAYVTLDSRDRCPFLDESGLCRIISSLGEGYVCEICREHPRFYHSVCGVVEGGIGAVCEEACRLILTSDGYLSFVENDMPKKEIPEITDFNTATHRKEIFDVICNENFTYIDKIDKICEKYVIKPEVIFDAVRDGIFSELELMHEESRRLFYVGKRVEHREAEKYAERFLAYLIYRHVSIATDIDNLRARLAFCLLLTLVLENLLREREGDELCDAIRFVRTISEEIEYSEENTALLIFEFETRL